MPNIVCTEADTERGLIDHIEGWTVAVTLPESGGMLYGRTVEVVVTGHGVDDDGEFVTLCGNVWDDAYGTHGGGNPDRPFAWTWADIETITLL